MRLFNPATGSRLSVPDHMVVRYLGKGWVQAAGFAAPAEPGPVVLDVAPPGVVTLARGSVPDGSAKDVIDWVGDDRDRARAALDAEQAKGDDARTTLVAKLTKLAGR